MEKKFDIRICKCGTIHAIPYKVIEDNCFTGGKNNKDVATICGRCGNIVIIGADYTQGYECDGNMIYDCYTKNLRTETNIIDIKNYEFEKPTELLYIEGYRVPMMNGEYANCYSYHGAGFEDMTYPDFTEIESRNTTMEDVHNWLEAYRKNRRTVNMSRLINELPKDVCEELSHYGIEGLNWTGTKFEKDFH